MATTERYDPEDLEALLSERAFEELLPEERAYVLRHVADGIEYEALRATLGRVRALPNEPLDADPEVRDTVLAAFREARRPGWTIWLNSVGRWLWPEQPVLWWRPALALATVALLVGVAVWVMEPAAKLRHAQVAEVDRRPTAIPEQAPSPSATATEATGPTTLEEATALVQERKAEPTVDPHAPASASPAAATGRSMEVVGVAPAENDATGMNAVDAITAAPSPREQDADDGAAARAEAEDLREDHATRTMHVGATRSAQEAKVARARAKELADTTDPMAAHADLFSLLHAAW